MELGIVQRVDIDQQMRSAYLSYAMSVITSRALPDVRDGLKPVQRRILYAMHDMGLRHDQPTRKSARIVGEVLGKYHPHGDSAVYDAMVRMAQDFSMRYPLVDGQGNFGSVDGDRAAAIRYTEARLTAIGDDMLVDLDKDTVDLSDNFDGSLREPQVLPSKLPNLVLNGVAGIAVGMATNIPPHNLGEIVDALVYLIDHYDRIDDVSVDDLLQYVKGPDFPTGGTIIGMEGIRQAYATGKGRLRVRAQAHAENLANGRLALIVTELPYQVNKSSLVERIASLVREDRVQGIGELRDESDRTGMRIVIEMKRGFEADPVLRQLLKYTQLETTFGVNMLALVDGEPRLLPLKRVLHYFVDHRIQVITRRTRYELERAEARAHILEGLLIALDNLDAVIRTIRRSRTADTAKTNLKSKFKLSEVQAQAILDMQLRRLAALERRRIQDEYKEIQARIEYLRDLLDSREKILGLVREGVLELKKTYGDSRRTRFSESNGDKPLRSTDLLPSEDALVLLTKKGTVRRLPVDSLTDRRRNVPGMSASERDALDAVVIASAQETVFFVTNKGSSYALPAHQIPDASQHPHGMPVSTLVRIPADETIIGMVHVDTCSGDRCLLMGTLRGQVKRLSLQELANASRGAVQVIGLGDDDELRWVLCSEGAGEAILVSDSGRAIRVDVETIRPQGRSARGVRGMTIGAGERIVAMDLVQDDGELVIATEHGFAKRSKLSEYSAQGRGGQGSLTVDARKTEMTGLVVDAKVVLPTDELVFCTDSLVMTRLAVADVPRLARASWGRVVTRTRRGAVVQVGDDKLRSVARLPMPQGGTHQGPSGPDVEPGPSAPSTETESPANKKPAPKTRRRSATTRTRKKPTAQSSTVAKDASIRRRRSTKAEKVPSAGSVDKPESGSVTASSAAPEDAQRTTGKGQRTTGKSQRTTGGIQSPSDTSQSKVGTTQGSTGQAKRRTRRGSTTVRKSRRRKRSATGD